MKTSRFIGVVITKRFFLSYELWQKNNERICPYCGGCVRWSYRGMDAGKVFVCGFCQSTLKFHAALEVETGHSQRAYFWRPSRRVFGKWRAEQMATIMRRAGWVQLVHYASAPRSNVRRVRAR